MQTKTYNINKHVIQVFLASTSLLILFTLYSFAEKEIDNATHFRLESFKLSHELRQSSNDLTHMVRTYVITKNKLYKEHYEEILAIRDGIKSRPLDYDNIYWDLVMLDDKRPCKNRKSSLSMLERMQKAGFTEQEFKKLAYAKQKSDTLTLLEHQAMKIIESKNLDDTQRNKAINLLYNAKYHEAKKDIMQPIADFSKLVEKRTHQEVQTANLLANILQILLGINILLLLFFLWKLKEVSFLILGAPLEDVHKQLSLLGQIDTTSLPKPKILLTNSIYGLISKTQLQLQKLHKRNQYLQNLYALLSQCNQAIIHSNNEKELFDSICQDTIKYGGFELAWIGTINKQSQEIDIVSSAGNATEYTKKLQLSINPKNLSSQGPAGQAYLQEDIQYFMDFQNSAKSSPWHAIALQFNLKSVVGIPLKQDGKVTAILTIYSNSQTFFNADAKKLLEEMNREINFALDNFLKAKQQQQSHANIYQLANYDSLTHLANRALFQDHFTQTLTLSKRKEQNFAMMFIDLDNFKEINDTLGHTTGDALLMKVAQRFKSISREEDTIARQGGDEFIFLFPNTQADEAAQIAQKLLETIEMPFTYKRQTLRTSISIGISMYPSDGENFETLAKNADTAMYKAKEDGKSRYHFYTQSMHEKSLRHLELSNELHTAIENDELEVYYQPQVDAKSKKLIGAEALLRWKHPKLGFIPPDEFIPIAEANSLIVPIGEWVLKTATKQVKTWLDEGHEPMLIAVNISSLQFRLHNITQIVEDILKENGLPPEYLELELTERLAMKNPENVIKTMNLLHEKGIKMSIDDFGTGYSSLNYLKKFKIYKLKIDQSFVRDITTDLDDKAIVNSIISMSQGLGFKTIAEGVETIEQLEYLKTQGCDEIQGYYFSKPLPAKEFAQFRDNLNRS